MLFCLNVTYTPQALQSLMDHPTTSRADAARQLIEAAGGKMVAFYSTIIDGPGAMVIFDVPDPGYAPAISGLVMSTGTARDIRLQRLLTPDEVVGVRQKAASLRSAYKPPTG